MRILVQRYSALGDIALLLPVLAALKRDQPDVEIHLVSKPFIKSLLGDLDIHFHAADLKGQHKGVLGLWKLAFQLKKEVKPDLIIDAHNVLRSRILNGFFRTMGLSVFRINKEREARKGLVRKENKIVKPLKHTSIKYAETLEKAGLKFHYSEKEKALYPVKTKTTPDLLNPQAQYHLGIAPMAKHKAKRYPLVQMQKVLAHYSGNTDYHFYLFGGAEEAEELEALGNSAKINFSLIAGKLNFSEEIALIKQLHLMLAMDSSNMHLAALAGIKIISIWGATHSLAGFSPIGNHSSLMVQVPREDLSCRPCSVFGNKKCFRGDYACLNLLEPAKVIATINAALISQN
jgi:ADP-heptose:LPS heptosyltransferase